MSKLITDTPAETSNELPEEPEMGQAPAGDEFLNSYPHIDHFSVLDYYKDSKD